MSDEPKCRVCGGALRDHLGHDGLCRQVQTLLAIDKVRLLSRLAAQCEGRAATIRRLLEEIEERDMEISCLKTVITEVNLR